MSAPAGLARLPVTVHQDGSPRSDEDWLVEETPVELRYNGVSFAVMMATPVDLEDFAYGFSLSEDRVARVSDIQGVAIRSLDRGHVIDVAVSAALPVSLSPELARLMPGRSGCGLCGNRRLEDVMRPAPPVLNASAGAVHAAAWATPAGEILHVREDVGRHNALDKLLGALARAGIDPRHGFVLVTSRASYEMVTKAARCGVGLLAAISAPTALAVELAEASNLTLVAFVRAGRHVVYSHPRRMPAQGLEASARTS